MNNEFVNKGNAFWLVAILFTILSCLLGGCDYNYAPKGAYIVEKVEQSRYQPFKCRYFVKDDDIVFWDSCGKWNIGDTIIIKW